MAEQQSMKSCVWLQVRRQEQAKTLKRVRDMFESKRSNYNPMDLRENLKKFKVIYSQQYIQIVPLLSGFKSQILINKRSGQVVFEDISKQFQFSGSPNVKYASLIMGRVNIESDSFLLFVEEVYLQPSYPPYGAGVYQIATIDYVQYGMFVSSRQKEIFANMKTEIFNFGFYFSFERDLTQTFQLHSAGQTQSREMYFWNLSMIEALLGDVPKSEWYVPIIQGHYGKFQTTLHEATIDFYLISRRSKYRSGTRFYNRGIDENSKCSQFIETEQILVLLGKLTSFVMLSGSVPLFWEQKSQSDKIRLTRNKELASVPFMSHFRELSKDFGRVMAINLLERKKQQQNLLLQAFEQLFQEHQETLKDSCRYFYFDINDTYKQRNHQQIFQVLGRLDPLLKEFGFFRLPTEKIMRKPTVSQFEMLVNSAKPSLSAQTGVFRISCLDCLFRTNNFMQTLSFYVLHQQLFEAGAINSHLSSSTIMELLFTPDGEVSALILLFRNLWKEKADFESMIYTGSRATNSKKSKFLDELENSLISLQRLYNQKFIDTMKQKSLDIILHHKSYDFETNLKGRDKMPFTIAIVTWNVNATKPEKLAGITNVLSHCQGADFLVFGMQEMVQLSTNNVISNNEEESEYSMAWGKQIEKILQSQSEKFIFVQKIEMVGLMAVAFVKEKWKHAIKSVQKDSIKTGMGAMYGNKGAVVIRVQIFQTTICFMCSHLAAGGNKAKERVDDFLNIHKKAFQQSKPGVQNETEVEYSDYKFFFGDLNFRVEKQFETVKALMEKAASDSSLRGEILEELLKSDQLTELRKNPNTPTLLTNYTEPDINFLPTYKLNKTTGAYTTEKARVPSWCDRILYWTNESELSCQCVTYESLNVVGSDHRPVFGAFQLTILKESAQPSQS